MKDDDLVAAHRADIHKAPDHLVHQWHAAIDDAAASERERVAAAQRGRERRPLFFGLAVMTALAAGIGLGVFLSPSATLVETPRVAEEQSSQPLVIPAAFTRELRYHLNDSKQQISRLGQNPEAALLVFDIIEQNRLFETAAENNNAPEVARVLRAFEPILLRLAANDIAPEDAEALRVQLSFELNVMLTKLSLQPSDKSQTT